MVEMDKPTRCAGLVMNAPAAFARQDFMAWLNRPDNQVATWHRRPEPQASEYSDTTVLVDSNYEGDASEMPEDVWRAICDAVYAEFCPGSTELRGNHGHHVMVRLTNLAT